MKKITVSVFVVAVLIVFSCNQAGQKSKHSDAHIAAQDSVYQVTMDFHDVIMPKLGDMGRLSQELRKFIPSDQLDETQKEEVYQSTLNLEKAEEAMMDWMQTIKQPAALRDSLSHEAIMSFLAVQQKGIEQVGEKISASMTAGNELLTKLNTAQSNK